MGWAQDPGQLPESEAGWWSASNGVLIVLQTRGLVTWRTSGILIEEHCGIGTDRNRGSASEALNGERGPVEDLTNRKP